MLPEEITRISPEGLAVIEGYLANGQDILRTAESMNLPVDEVNRLLNKKESAAYLDRIYNESGFRNRAKMAALMDEIINSKLEEMIDTGQTSSKDILEILKTAHDMKMKEIEMQIKLANLGNDKPAIQINQQINGGTNYNSLLEKLTKME